MQCFILAGGFATRLWPLTEKRAKPLLALAGKPIITHLVENVPHDLEITISTNAVFEESFKKWKNGIQRDMTILIEDISKDDQKLGALGATAKWITEEKIDDDILLLTGDNYCGFSLKEFLERFHGSTLIAAYDIKNLEKAKRYGTIILQKDSPGKILSVETFEEKPHEPKTTLVNTGVSIIPKHILPILVEFSKKHPDNVGGIFEELLKKKERIECFAFREIWFDIGSFESYLEATQSLVGTQAIFGINAKMEDSQTYESVVIGAGSCIKNSSLRNVVIFDQCEIDDCELENCIIDNYCRLKGVDLRGKMIREGTTLMK